MLILFILGAWNVRTLLDRAGTLRLERRTALVVKELQRYRIYIAALSETRLADEGSLREEEVATSSSGKENCKLETGFMVLVLP